MNVSDRSETSAAPHGSTAADHVHVTFTFHCAVLQLPDKRGTDVILAPGVRHGAGNSAANGRAGNGHTERDAHEAGSAAETMHQAEHIASLRVPGECVENDKQHPGTPQITTRLDRADAVDLTWRLEGCDVELRTAARPGATPEPPANVSFTTAVDDVTYVVPDLSSLAGMKIDPVFYGNGAAFPHALRKGARVRLNGGTLECGVPTGPLKHRRWKIGTAEDVGLSDRMEYRKDLYGGFVELIFRTFEEGETQERKVLLKPGPDGVVRIHVSNDPFAEDPPLGSKQMDPCAALPHFPSYSLLLYPAGEDKSSQLRPPVALDSGADDPLLVSEGNSACCPCARAPSP